MQLSLGSLLPYPTPSLPFWCIGTAPLRVRPLSDSFPSLYSGAFGLSGINVFLKIGTLHLLNLYLVPQKIQKKRIIGPKPLKVFPCEFFDGAVAKHLGGAGFVIYLNDNHYFSFSLGCGCSTNARAELLALWAVLRVSLIMGLPIHLISGDSMVIISWLNRLSALDIPSLRHWCDDIRDMLHLDPPVIFKHIF